MKTARVLEPKTVEGDAPNSPASIPAARLPIGMNHQVIMNIPVARPRYLSSSILWTVAPPTEKNDIMHPDTIIISPRAMKYLSLNPNSAIRLPIMPRNPNRTVPGLAMLE